MFARNALRVGPRIRPRAARLPQRVQRRRYSAQSAPAPAQVQAQGQVGALAPFVSELDRIAPAFDVRGGDVRIIKTPAEFYETLKGKIRGAERRVFLATLYIGKSEQELVSHPWRREAINRVE